MRLDPIARPASWVVRIACRYSQRKFGKVLTTLTVIYARAPRLLRPYATLLASERKLSAVPPPLRLLVKARVAAINGCALCADIARYEAKDPGLRGQLNALDVFRTSPLFTARERAALAFVEEATRNKTVGDSTFATLRAHWSEHEIVELTWLNALENFLNLTTVPLQIGSDDLCALRGPESSRA